MRDFTRLGRGAGRIVGTKGVLRCALLGLAFGAALGDAGRAHAENWVNIPGADECRVDMDSTAYDAQADVVAFRYVCPGAEASSVAVGCTSNESWRGSSAPPAASSRGWLSDLFRSRGPVAPATGTYTNPQPIERGTPIGRGRQLVCDSKDRYKPFKFTGAR